MSAAVVGTQKSKLDKRCPLRRVQDTSGVSGVLRQCVGVRGYRLHVRRALVLAARQAAGLVA